MPSRRMRWEYVALAAVLTLAVLSLAYYSYESLGVRRQLEKALLADPDVNAVTISKTEDGLVIEVALDRVEDLGATYSRLHDAVRDRLGQGRFRLAVKDQRDGTLQDLYHSIHYYLEEAAARGNFGAMADACSDALTRAGVTAHKITVDPHRIYVQISLHGPYLYQVLERPRVPQGGAGQ